MNGGSTEVAIHVWRGFSAVADLTGERASGSTTAPEDGLSLASFTVGPRFSYGFSGTKLSRYTPFVQGLVGTVHGFDSQFPNSDGTVSGAANSLSVLADGGLDITVKKHLAIRVIQADYLRTRLPNNAGNEQNLLRLGAGVVFRIW